MQSPSSYTVMAVYKFIKLENYKFLREPLLRFCLQKGIKGTLLLAEEGLNGTVCGTQEAIKSLLAYIQSFPEIGTLEYKLSYTSKMPFLRTKVKLKKEIVTMGVDSVEPVQKTGCYVEADDWDKLLKDPDVLVLDTRNDYEVEVGAFKGAINPQTTNFREFPEYVHKNLDTVQNRKIAMYCTGGIRCEKASSYLLAQGFDQVYQLKGGILKYLADKPDSDAWQGECFVFDNRVTVNKDLQPGRYQQCFGCRYPLSPREMEEGPYKAGVYCPHCYSTTPTKTHQRAEERQKQMTLAAARGKSHIGDATGER